MRSVKGWSHTNSVRSKNIAPETSCAFFFSFLFHGHQLNPTWKLENQKLLSWVTQRQQARPAYFFCPTAVDAGTILLLLSGEFRDVHRPSNNYTWFLSSTPLWTSQVQAFLSQTLVVKGFRSTVLFAGNTGLEKMLLPIISSFVWRAVFSTFMSDLPPMSGKFLDRLGITCWKWKARPTVVLPCVTHYCWHQNSSI